MLPTGRKRLGAADLWHMEQALAEHYGEPVRPVSHYCNAFETWCRVVQENYPETSSEAMSLVAGAIERAYPTLWLAITKSSLLARMIYGGEELRTEKCPEHHGQWMGIFRCPHGCDGTGWLPKEKG